MKNRILIIGILCLFLISGISTLAEEIIYLERTKNKIKDFTNINSNFDYDIIYINDMDITLPEEGGLLLMASV